jgi:hypothetical protein
VGRGYARTLPASRRRQVAERLAPHLVVTSSSCWHPHGNGAFLRISVLPARTRMPSVGCRRCRRSRWSGRARLRLGGAARRTTASPLQPLAPGARRSPAFRTPLIEPCRPLARRRLRSTHGVSSGTLRRPLAACDGAGRPVNRGGQQSTPIQLLLPCLFPGRRTHFSQTPKS